MVGHRPWWVRVAADTRLNAARDRVEVAAWAHGAVHPSAG
jgi:hypothetical protein